MNKVHVSCISAAILGLGSTGATAALDRTGDFALLDNSGEFHQLSRYQHRKAVVLMSYAQNCHGMEDMLSEYRALQSRYGGQGIEFLLLDSHDLGRAALADLNAGLPILQDSGQLVSEALGIRSAGEVRVLNPDRMSLFYSGMVSTELDQTLSGLLQGPIRDTVKVEGSNSCEIAYPVRDAHLASVPDYATEVAPVIIENCVQCHRQFGAGPFPMDRYISLLGWSPMIKEVLLNKRMPPAQIDPERGHSPTARYLATEDIQTIVHWINAGGPRGEGADPLAELRFEADQAWILGEPDYVLTTPVHAVPASGILDEIYVDMELPFEEDKWLRAVQFQPTANGTLHHLIAVVTEPDEDFWGDERSSTTATRRFVEGYQPGKAIVSEFSEGTGVFIPKGHKLSMQFQYVGMGVAVSNVNKIGFYFAEESSSELTERLVQAVSTPFVLPPNQHDIPVEAEYVFTEDVVITGVRARMNERGKKMSFSVTHPDGTTHDILSIPAYNYAWQPHYVLANPVRVPAGSIVHVIGAFDNSVSNPFNPDPGAEVRSGLGNDEEMFTGYFTFHRASE
ncbi:MAG: redoxin domain-containing protein [Gammaproteobacteria bacterium]|nr:redoxin domain-containing protein [Gammaproteobacteria bacterium]MDP2142047.1 redoxin domain-containing protein [Gammaproteobacteria bacterium]MDP2348374.1 redoxin domain-containing protein [Gammaproteobacteria bacterium]